MLSRNELASALGADPSLTGRWIKRGMPADDLQAAKDWHRDHIRTRRKRKQMAPATAGQGGNGHDRPLSWRDRLDRAKALRCEWDNAIFERKLFPEEVILEALATDYTAMQARLLGVAARVSQRFEDGVRQKVHALIEHEIGLALRSLAGLPERLRGEK